MAQENRLIIMTNDEGHLMIGVYPGLGADFIVKLIVALYAIDSTKAIMVRGLTDDLPVSPPYTGPLEEP